MRSDQLKPYFKQILGSAPYFVLGLLAVGVLSTGIYFVTYCSTEQHDFISLWDLPPGNYSCLICGVLTNESMHNAWQDENCTIEKYATMRPIHYGGIVFRNWLGGY